MRFAILTLLLTASPVFATSYAQPERHDEFSQNRAFVLDVDPQTSVHTVYNVRDRTKPLWSFSKPVWHYPFMVSDDGTVVATIAWRYVRADSIASTNAVQFWNKDGNFRSYTFDELCPNPPKTKYMGVGPIGDFWRTWCWDVEDHGDSFVLRTTSGIAYRFQYADGELVESKSFGVRKWFEWLLITGLVVAVSLATVFLCWRAANRRFAASSSPK